MNHKYNEKCGCNGRHQPPCGGLLSPRGAYGNTVWKRREACCRTEGPFDRAVQEKGARESLSSGESLAMVYAPMQRFEELYDPRNGLCSGTLFTRLDKPFYGDRRGC